MRVVVRVTVVQRPLVPFSHPLTRSSRDRLSTYAMPRLSRPANVLVTLIALSCAASFFLLSPARLPDDQRTVGGGSGSHRLAIIVPFRSRFDELMQFVPHMTSFLHRQNINFTIHIMNQVDELRFNRASLINAGFLLFGRDADYIAMHDVDLLPLNDGLSYRFPGRGTPFHVSSPDLHPKYHYPSFVGGILLITSHDFEQVDGMSNKYWGWGLEDDEFFVRLKEMKMNISRPKGMTSGRNASFLHNHKKSHKRDTAKLFNQREVTKRRDRETGLHNLEFELVANWHLLVNGSSCFVHDIRLICRRDVTAWCEPRSRNNSFPKK